MAEYDPAAREDVEEAVHEYKHEGKFKSFKQAVAVGLNKARRKGKRVPEK